MTNTTRRKPAASTSRRDGTVPMPQFRVKRSIRRAINMDVADREIKVAPVLRAFLKAWAEKDPAALAIVERVKPGTQDG